MPGCNPPTGLIYADAKFDWLVDPNGFIDGQVCPLTILTEPFTNINSLAIVTATRSIREDSVIVSSYMFSGAGENYSARFITWL